MSRLDFLKNQSRRVIFYALLVFMAASAVMAQFRISVDQQEVRCMPWKYALSYPIIGDLHKGDYIEFVAAKNVFFGKNQGLLVGKQIRGVPGDEITISDGLVKLNGKPVGLLSSYILKKLDKSAQSFDAHYVLGPNQYFVMGLLHRSFDSRYWGPINGDLVLHKSLGLF